MMKAYPRAAPPILQTNGLVKGTRLDVLTRLMGCTNNNETVDLVKSLDIQTVNEGGEIDGENPIAAVIGSGAAFNGECGGRSLRRSLLTLLLPLQTMPTLL